MIGGCTTPHFNLIAAKLQQDEASASIAVISVSKSKRFYIQKKRRENKKRPFLFFSLYSSAFSSFHSELKRERAVYVLKIPSPIPLLNNYIVIVSLFFFLAFFVVFFESRQFVECIWFFCMPSSRFVNRQQQQQ